jgi:hypothetical protein
MYAVEAIPESDFLQACHHNDDWHTHVTQPLRNTRRWVKKLDNKVSWVEEFAQQLVMDEIVSETYQQFQLYSYFHSRQKKVPQKNEAQALDYLRWMFADLGHPMDEALQTTLTEFITHIYSMVSP